MAADLRVGPIQDLGLLDCGAHRPSASVFGRDAYPDLGAKAGALLESIVVNHPLRDSNRRLGWLAVVAFYGINGTDREAPDDDAYDRVIAVAGGKADHQPLLRACAHSVSVGTRSPGK